MPARPAGAVEKIAGCLSTILITENRVETGVRPHPVGGHNETSECVLEPLSIPEMGLLLLMLAEKLSSSVLVSAPTSATGL